MGKQEVTRRDAAVVIGAALVGLAALLGCNLSKTVTEIAEPSFTIATGSKTGSYFKAATDLKEFVKLDIKNSKGSWENFELLVTNKHEIGFVQWDTVALMKRHGGSTAASASKVRIVAPVGYEAVHVVVNKAANIKKITDLRGKKLAIGKYHSGSWISADNLIFNKNAPYKIIADTCGGADDFKECDKPVIVDKNTKTTFYTMNSDDALPKLIAGEVDVVIITGFSGGLESLKKLDASNADKIELLDFGADFPSFDDYQMMSIPAKTFPWQPKEINTPHTPTYLMTSMMVSQTKIEHLVKKLFGNAEKLKKKGAAWEKLDPHAAKDEAEKPGKPYHLAAKKFLKEMK